MCGIVGMVSSTSTGFTAQQEKAFNQLLLCDVLRGDDSTGVFGVNKYGNVDYLKACNHAPTFMSSSEYKTFSRSIFTDHRMVCGHNRKATRGTTNDENAHPFVEEDNILVHNGTLFNHKALTDKEVEVDSHAILHAINKYGVDEAIKKIQGAFALVWYNSTDKEFHIIRNTERPMVILNTPGAWFFGSELKLLEWIMDRNGIKIAETIHCKPGTLHTFKLDDHEHMWRRELELYKTPTITSIVDHSKKKSLTITKNQEETFNQKDFVIGTKIIVTGLGTHNVKANSHGKDRLITGHWFFHEEIVVRTWTNDKEMEQVTDLPKKGKADISLFQATIRMVMSKNGKTTLICDTPTDYTPETDSVFNEIFEDNFMLTTQHCSACNTKMSFDDAKKGTFEYTNKNEAVLICEACTNFSNYGHWAY